MHLQVGDHAPAFTGKDQEEKAIQLANFAGKKLVLYFYPQDNTPGCTAQAYNLRDNYQALQQAGVFSIYFYNTNPFHKSHFVRLTPYAMCKKSWRRFTIFEMKAIGTLLISISNIELALPWLDLYTLASDLVNGSAA